MELTQQTLKELFEYDPDTGVFKRLKRTSSNAISGRICGCKSNGYIVIHINGRLWYGHRLAWLYVYGTWPNNNIDHINGDKSDNRISNLRDATQTQNHYNVGKKSSNKSGFKGVSWHVEGKKWDAKIRHNGRRIYLGLFDTPEEAHAAYVEAAKHLHGDFARFD